MARHFLRTGFNVVVLMAKKCTMMTAATGATALLLPVLAHNLKQKGPYCLLFL